MRVYLDYNASTPIAGEVAEAMSEFIPAHYGNPSTTHWAGAPAKSAVVRARGQVASLVGAKPSEIVFTSGGSEANNHAIKGAVFRALRSGSAAPHIIASTAAHPAIHAPLAYLEQFGARVSLVPVDRTGRICPDAVRAAVTPDTMLVTIMHANNETGTLQPIREIADVAHEAGALMHSDAAQSVGKVPTRVDELGVDLLSIAGHKLYAPKGVGALYVRDGVEIDALVHGGSQEGGRRAGTENVVWLVALGAACELAETDPVQQRLTELRDYFWAALRERFGDAVALNGHPEHRLPNTLNVGFVGRIGAEVLDKLEGVAASTGSACHSGERSLSPVLAAMGVDPNIGLGAIRFSLGRSTTREQLDHVVTLLESAL